MDFAVMQWVGDAKEASIFGILDAAEKNPVLPMLSDKGHWAEFRRLPGYRFAFASEAKGAIAEHGYYLMGAGVTTTEAFGPA